MICQHKSGRRDIRWWLKLNPLWALFGNVDDGLFGDLNFNPQGKRSLWTAIKWWFRNPMHNLMFYVVGVADKPRMICGPWADAHDRGAEGGLLWSLTYVGRRWRLPYVNYTKGRIKAYAGWRPSGAFGFKLNIRWKA